MTNPGSQISDLRSQISDLKSQISNLRFEISYRAWSALLVCLVATAAQPAAGGARWEGVDKTVIEKFAEEAGHPARQPYFNTDQGDLLLFLFLLAGALGGFVAGYAFRALFPPKSKSSRTEMNREDTKAKAPRLRRGV